MRPGADSLDRMGILRSWRLSSWLSRWARCREQPWDSCKHKSRLCQPALHSPRLPQTPTLSGQCSLRQRKGPDPRESSPSCWPHCTDGQAAEPAEAPAGTQQQQPESAPTQGDGELPTSPQSPGILHVSPGTQCELRHRSSHNECFKNATSVQSTSTDVHQTSSCSNWPASLTLQAGPANKAFCRRGVPDSLGQKWLSDVFWTGSLCGCLRTGKNCDLFC